MTVVVATMMRMALCEYRGRKQQQQGEGQQLFHTFKDINNTRANLCKTDPSQRSDGPFR